MFNIGALGELAFGEFTLRLHLFTLTTGLHVSLLLISEIDLRTICRKVNI